MAQAEDQHDSNTSSSTEIKQAETNEKVKKAFEQAAKNLGVKVAFKGNYIYIDQECPPEIKAKLKATKDECAADSGVNADVEIEDKECTIGDLKVPNIEGKPKLGDRIPGTRFLYSEVVKSDSFQGNKQFALDKLDKGILNNTVYTFQQLEKFLQATGASGTVTSSLRSIEYAKKMGWSTTSSHNTGFAVDFKPNGSVRQLFSKVIEMVNKGNMCGNQFIYEIKKGQRENGAIIHFDFSRGGTSVKGGTLVGGQGAGAPYYQVKDEASFEQAITKRLADFK